jgi:uncharacterized membrane protein
MNQKTDYPRLEVVGMPNWKPFIAASMVLGIGMGGFFDGILFHQILQLHNMLSNQLFPDTLVNAEINMFWDGLFHAFTWITTLVGLGLLWRAIRKSEVPLSTRALVSGMFLGWGVFNLVEGVIDHQILGLHHVVERASGSRQLLYDLLFLASGLIFIVGGLLGIRSAKRAFEFARSTARGTRSFPESEATPGLIRVTRISVQSQSRDGENAR